jgi:hypothetical protein
MREVVRRREEREMWRGGVARVERERRHGEGERKPRLETS